MTPSKYLVEKRLAELERERAFGTNPSASRLWTLAPHGLRNRYADGVIDASDFWNKLERWLAFDLRGAA